MYDPTLFKILVVLKKIEYKIIDIGNRHPDNDILRMYTNLSEYKLNRGIQEALMYGFIDKTTWRITGEGTRYLFELFLGDPIVYERYDMYDRAYSVLGYDLLTLELIQKMAEFLRAHTIALRNNVTTTHATSMAFAELEIMIEAYRSRTEQSPGEAEKLCELRAGYLKKLENRIKQSEEKGRPITPLEESTLYDGESHD